MNNKLCDVSKLQNDIKSSKNLGIFQRISVLKQYVDILFFWFTVTALTQLLRLLRFSIKFQIDSNIMWSRLVQSCA